MMEFFLSLQRPHDSTAPMVSLGLQGVDRRHGSIHRSAGQESVIKIRLDFQTEAKNIKPPQTLDLILKNQTTLATQVQEFVLIQNQFMGWIFGNNPAR